MHGLLPYADVAPSTMEADGGWVSLNLLEDGLLEDGCPQFHELCVLFVLEVCMELGCMLREEAVHFAM